MPFHHQGKGFGNKVQGYSQYDTIFALLLGIEGVKGVGIYISKTQHQWYLYLVAVGFRLSQVSSTRGQPDAMVCNYGYDRHGSLPIIGTMLIILDSQTG